MTTYLGKKAWNLGRVAIVDTNDILHDCFGVVGDGLRVVEVDVKREGNRSAKQQAVYDGVFYGPHNDSGKDWLCSNESIERKEESR